MAGRVSRRRDDRHTAVAEHVVIAFELGHGLLRFEARTDRRRPLVFGLLHQQGRLREQRHVADVIGMRVRHGDIFDVGRFHTEFIELRDKGLGPPPMSRPRVGGALPSGIAAMASARPVSHRSQPCECLIR